jgi:hypothetical protein
MSRPPLVGVVVEPPSGFEGHLAFSPAVDLLTDGARPDLVEALLAIALRAAKGAPGTHVFKSAGNSLLTTIVGRHADASRAVWVGSQLEVDLAGPGATPEIFAVEARARA